MKYYAQSGEDKFLEPLLPDKGFFVDVGAYDGKAFSNTLLFAQKGWDGICIEENLKYCRSMKLNMPPNITIVPRRVGAEDMDGLLELYGVSRDFELLSVDIDSYDYVLWKKVNRFHPKFVVIEVGSWIEPRAMKLLGESKGYKLIWDKANFIFQSENS